MREEHDMSTPEPITYETKQSRDGLTTVSLGSDNSVLVIQRLSSGNYYRTDNTYNTAAEAESAAAIELF